MIAILLLANDAVCLFLLDVHFTNCGHSVYLLDQENYLILRYLGVKNQIILPLYTNKQTAILLDEYFLA